MKCRQKRERKMNRKIKIEIRIPIYLLLTYPVGDVLENLRYLLSFDFHGIVIS
jgi:hypothetical protein